MSIDIDRPTFTATPELKKLTQAVFDGLPAEYRFAVISDGGFAWAAQTLPSIVSDAAWHDATPLRLVGSNYDATDWQNSLIERVAEPVTDLNQAPEGATHYTIKESGAIWFKDDYSFWNIWDNGEWEAIGRPASELTALPQSDLTAKHYDPVNSPSHYASGGIECIDAMQAMLSREEFIGYLRGNIFKYQWRYKLKNGVEDLKKAQWYANRLIELEQGK